MNLLQILLIFRARYKVGLVIFLMVLLVAVPVIYNLPKQYSATTALVIDIRAPDPITAMLRPGSMATQEDIIKSDRVAQRVLKVLKLDENPTARDQWRESTGGTDSLWKHALWHGRIRRNQ